VPTHDVLRNRWVEKNPSHAYGLGGWQRYERGVFSPISKDTVKRQIVEILEALKGEGVRSPVGLLASVLALASVKLAVPDEEWDADTDILVCANGALQSLRVSSIPTARSITPPAACPTTTTKTQWRPPGEASSGVS
jgi:hypothetical protein